MKRLIDRRLLEWADDSDKKSRLLRGARQVGKTYSC
jgi:predicted AAA+ superfamily ATPase